MHFQFIAAIFDSSRPVTSESADNMDDISSELNDIGIIMVANEIWMIYWPEAEIHNFILNIGQQT